MLAAGDENPESWTLWMAELSGEDRRSRWDELRDGNVKQRVAAAKAEADPLN